MRRHVIGGSLVIGLGILIAVLTFAVGNSSPRGWIERNYTRVTADTYRSSAHPLQVARTMVRRYEPIDRVYDPTGVFLRYRKVVVGVLPDGTGSRITLDTPSRGYARHHSSVGGRWGGWDGRASTFRGGGPGEGK